VAAAAENESAEAVVWPAANIGVTAMAAYERPGWPAKMTPAAGCIRRENENGAATAGAAAAYPYGFRRENGVSCLRMAVAASRQKRGARICETVKISMVATKLLRLAVESICNLAKMAKYQRR